MNQENDRQRLGEELRGLLLKDDPTALTELLDKHHPADLAQGFVELSPDEQEQLLTLWPTARVAELLSELAEHFAEGYFESVHPSVAARALGEVPADEAADLLFDLEEDEQEVILNHLPLAEATSVRKLLGHDEDTAGGRMGLDFVSVSPTVSVEEAQRLITESIGEERHVHCYLVDDSARFAGVVFIDRLTTADHNLPIGDLREDDYPTVLPGLDQEDLAALFQRYDLLAIPVVDETGVLLGEVTVDDILEVIREEASEDIFKMVGTSDEELEVRGALSVVRLRLPWLVICLAGALLSGAIIHLFSYALEKVVALAAFIPVITAMGGNAGLQSSTVVVRNLALGKVEPIGILRTVLRELRVGLLLGFFSGIIAGGVAWIMQGNPMLGAVVGMAMVGAIVISTLMGALMPLVFKKIGADPAVASGPFITTANDMIGLTIYLGLGMLLLRHLG